MIINLGSKNQVKIEALEECLNESEFFGEGGFLAGIKVDENNFLGVYNVNPRVSKQPLSLQETIMGARNRSHGAFNVKDNSCDYGVGIESGLVNIYPIGKEYIGLTVCNIYDGKRNYIGVSPAYKLPGKLVDLIIDEGLDINEASFKSGLTCNPKIGSDEGIISILSKGKVSRKEYMVWAIKMALINLEGYEFYE